VKKAATMQPAGSGRWSPSPAAPWRVR
jgi:hypothetical protein